MKLHGLPREGFKLFLKIMVQIRWTEEGQEKSKSFDLSGAHSGGSREMELVLKDDGYQLMGQTVLSSSSLAFSPSTLFMKVGQTRVLFRLHLLN